MNTYLRLSLFVVFSLIPSFFGETRGEIYRDFIHFWKVLREKESRVQSIYLEQPQYLKSQKIEQARVAFYHGQVAFSRGMKLLEQARNTYRMEPDFIKLLEERLSSAYEKMQRYSQWVLALREEDLEARKLGVKPSLLVADRKYYDVASNGVVAGIDLIKRLQKAVELYDLQTKTTLVYARDEVSKIVAAFPEFLPAKLWLARIHFELEEVKTAGSLLDSLEKEDPEFRIARSLDEIMMSVDPLTLRVLPQHPVIVEASNEQKPPKKIIRESESKDQIQRVPFGVVLGNTKAERPQSGLSRASVVYEMPVEGGITRLLAMFSMTHEKSFPIGPVRSLRPYILEEVFAVDPLLVHCGASIGGMRALKDLGLDTVDQLRDFLPFWRNKSEAAPGNLYTSLQKLEEAAFSRLKLMGNALDLMKTSGKGFPFEDNTTKSIHLEISSGYSLSYHMNRGHGAYDRRVNGVVQLDGYDSSPILVHNLIFQFVEESIHDETGLKRLKNLGEGKLIAFVKGKRIDGIWRKSAVDSETLYLTKDQSEILFLPHLTWIHMISPSVQVRIDQWSKI